jgi:hypothetical protein
VTTPAKGAATWPRLSRLAFSAAGTDLATAEHRQCFWLQFDREVGRNGETGLPDAPDARGACWIRRRAVGLTILDLNLAKLLTKRSLWCLSGCESDHITWWVRNTPTGQWRWPKFDSVVHTSEARHGRSQRERR